MDIVLSSDDNYVQHCAVTMVSVLRNNKNVKFFLLTEGLSTKNQKLLQNLVSQNGGRLKILTINNDILRHVPMPQNISVSHISVATYYRLFVASLLPSGIDKILYLDCDIVVRENLTELYSTEMDGYALAAVFQDDALLLQGDEFERLGIPSEQGYFNAGVLLINLKYWRDNIVENKLLNYIQANYLNIKFHDQDTLNAVLGKMTLCLPCKWNMLSVFLTKGLYKFTSKRCAKYRDEILSGSGKNPIIVHFVSRPKPWEWTCSHPYKSEYYKFLDYTPYKGWKPAKQIKLNSIKEKIKNMVPFKYLPIFKDEGIFIKFK